MNVFIDTSPLTTGHKVRGVGVYTQNLIRALQQYHPEIVLVSTPEKADIIHYPYFDYYFVTLPLFKKRKTVVTVHDTIPLIYSQQVPPGIKGRLKYQLQLFLLKRCQAIMATSQSSKNDIVRYLKINAEKVHVVYQSYDPAFRPLQQAILAKLQQSRKWPSRFILYVGDVNYNKNIPRLISAFAAIAEKDVYLVLVGKAFLDRDLKEAQQVDALIRQYQLGNRVIRTGYLQQDKLVQAYNLATIYMQPSLYEGFGIPVLQAFACGVPVISSTRGALHEVIGQAAYSIDPEDTKSMTHAINRLLTDSSLQHTLTTLGFKQVAFFSQKNFADQAAQVYQHLSPH